MFPVKQCIHPGCKGLAVFGFGRPSTDKMKWACRAHRELLQIAVPCTTKEDGSGTSPHRDPRPSSTQPVQARLL